MTVCRWCHEGVPAIPGGDGLCARCYASARFCPKCGQIIMPGDLDPICNCGPISFGTDSEDDGIKYARYIDDCPPIDPEFTRGYKEERDKWPYGHEDRLVPELFGLSLSDIVEIRMLEEELK